MILGKSDKNKIYHLPAMNNTAGLCVESSFHVPKMDCLTFDTYSLVTA